MELDIFNDGGERILNRIMCGNVFSPPHEHNKIGVSLLNLWASHICIEKYHKP
jgi:hypothetical protein